MTMSTLANSLRSVQQRTPTKRTTKPKKNKPIKVVYISNPMKVKTSAAGFRALVQELTGRDAESPPHPSMYGGGGGVHETVDDEDCVKRNINGENIDHTLVNVMPSPLEVGSTNTIISVHHGQQQQQQLDDGVSSMMETFEPFDDVFTPQMIESLSDFLPHIVF